jgi:hypothetical protein
VGAGGKAIVAGRKRAAQDRGYLWGAKMKSGQRPYEPDWKAALALARAAPRCRARYRRSKLPCCGRATGGWPVMSLTQQQGWRSQGEVQWRLPDWGYPAKTRAERQASRAVVRELRRLIYAGDWGRVRVELVHFEARAVFQPVRAKTPLSAGSVAGRGRLGILL